MLNSTSEFIELTATILSLLYLYFISKSHSIAWYFAIASVSLFGYLVFQQKLYSQFILQCFYVLTSIAGWWNWNQNKSGKIISYSVKKHILIIVTGTILGSISGYIMHQFYEANFAYLDAWVSVFSIIATIMVIYKILENWLYWIVIDIISFYLYIEQNLKIGAILFLIYTVMAIFGYWEWRKKWQQEQSIV